MSRTLSEVRSDLLRQFSTYCESFGEEYPSWPPGEFRLIDGFEAQKMMKSLGLEGWVGMRGREAATAFALAAAVAENP